MGRTAGQAESQACSSNTTTPGAPNPSITFEWLELPGRRYGRSGTEASEEQIRPSGSASILPNRCPNHVVSAT